MVSFIIDIVNCFVTVRVGYFDR